MHPKKPTESTPHTLARIDLDKDGQNDLFYLAGTTKRPQTCVFINQGSAKGMRFKLVHEHQGYYDSVFDFNGSGRAQIVVPEDLDKSCGSPEDLIDAQFKVEIDAMSQSWGKGFEKLNTPLLEPPPVPKAELYLVHPVHVFLMNLTGKKDAGPAAKPYLELKKKILTDILKTRSLPKACRTQIQQTLKSLMGRAS